MPKSKKMQIAGLSREDLIKLMNEKSSEIIQSRVMQKSGNLSDTSVFIKLRRDIARIKTALNSKGEACRN